MTFCAHCGKPVNPGASFCAACGASVTPPAPAAAPPPAPAPAIAPSGALPVAAPAARGARPVGVSIIGVVMLVGAGGLVLLAALMIVWMFAGTLMAGAFDAAFPWFPVAGAVGAVFVMMALVAMVFLLGLAALGIAAGVGVLNGRSWAWPLTLVVMGLVGLSGLGDISDGDFGGGLFSLVVAGLVVWYFFQPDVKRWFGKA